MVRDSNSGSADHFGGRWRLAVTRLATTPLCGSMPLKVPGLRLPVLVSDVVGHSGYRISLFHCVHAWSLSQKIASLLCFQCVLGSRTFVCHDIHIESFDRNWSWRLSYWISLCRTDEFHFDVTTDLGQAKASSNHLEKSMAIADDHGLLYFPVGRCSSTFLRFLIM